MAISNALIQNAVAGWQKMFHSKKQSETAEMTSFQYEPQSFNQHRNTKTVDYFVFDTFFFFFVLSLKAITSFQVRW